MEMVFMGDQPQAVEPQQFNSASRERCIAAIHHQTALDIFGQLECARNGYAGNAAWPITPAPQPLQLPETFYPQIAGPESTGPTLTQPRVPEVAPPFVPLGQDCKGVNQWLSENPLMAFGIVIGFFALTGGSK